MPLLVQLVVMVVMANAIAAAVKQSSNVLPLRRRSLNSTAIPITSAEYGTMFDVEVRFGNQSFLLLFDTGSSDTWVVQTGFECINGTDDSQLPQAACNYASTYDVSPTFEQIDDEHFGVQYGTGIATGIIGYEDVELGGIKVKGQKIGVVNKAVNPGDGIDSGIVGFGYPSLTSAHPGTVVSNESQLLNRITYNPLFTSMYQQGSVEPFFSLAIERTPYNSSVAPAGYLALGGLPPVSHSSTFAVAPVEITDTVPLSFTNGTATITGWTLTVSQTSFGRRYENMSVFTNSTPFQAVVDAGQPQNVLPVELAYDINSRFDPPAIYDESSGVFYVQCNATPPTLGFMIGNQTFFHNGADLIISSGGEGCVSAVTATVPQDGLVINFLGDAFLKNVVAVFDFGKDEMRFAARSNNSDVVVPTLAATGVATSEGVMNAASVSGFACAIVVAFSWVL